MFKGSLRMGVMCQGAAVRLTMTNRLGIALKSVCRARTKQMFTTFYNRHTRIPHRRRERRQRDESRAKKKTFCWALATFFYIRFLAANWQLGRSIPFSFSSVLFALHRRFIVDFRCSAISSLFLVCSEGRRSLTTVTPIQHLLTFASLWAF